MSHGSRDPRPQATVNEIARKWQQQLATDWGHEYLNFARVQTGTLELNDLPLHLQIKELGEKAIAAGYQTLEICPLFLLPGVHVMEDIPNEVNLAKGLLPGEFNLVLRPYLGTQPQWQQTFAEQIATLDIPAQILLSHGSRRPQANAPVEELAKRLGMTPAYWSVSPSLKERVAELVDAGYTEIAIQPYFLFPGGITDAIAQTVTDLQQEYPRVEFKLRDLIDSSAILAALTASNSLFCP